MNKAFLIGNLTRDPELTETAGGVCVKSVRVSASIILSRTRLVANAIMHIASPARRSRGAMWRDMFPDRGGCASSHKEWLSRCKTNPPWRFLRKKYRRKPALGMQSGRTEISFHRSASTYEE